MAEETVYVIVKRGSKWCLLSSDRSKVLGCHSTREEAVAQERAVQSGKNSRNTITLSVDEVEFISPEVGAELKEQGIEEMSFAIPPEEELEAVEELPFELRDRDLGVFSREAWFYIYENVLGLWLSKVNYSEYDKHGKLKRKRLPVAMSSHKLEGVEIFETGTHNGKEFTERDLDSIVKAATDAGYTPPLKLGHDETPGRPAVGWIENLRRVGNKIIADITNIPKEVFDAIRSRSYDRVSAEIYWDLTVAGKKFRRALKAVALLGADVPAVTSLKPLRELFESCTGIVEQYDFGKWSEDSYIFDDNKGSVNEGGNSMGKEVEELQAQIKKLTEELAAAKEAKPPAGKEHVSLDQHTALEKQLQATQEQLGIMKSERTKERIGLKCNSMKIPSLRPFLHALYEIATVEGTDGKPRVVKFAASGKIEDQKEVVAEAVLDELITSVNKNAATMLSEYAQEDGTRPPGQEQAPEKSAADEVHDATLKYCTEHKKDPDKDYMEAMHAVLDADKGLAERYAVAQVGSESIH